MEESKQVTKSYLAGSDHKLFYICISNIKIVQNAKVQCQILPSTEIFIARKFRKVKSFHIYQRNFPFISHPGGFQPQGSATQQELRCVCVCACVRACTHVCAHAVCMSTRWLERGKGLGGGQFLKVGRMHLGTAFLLLS